MTIHLICDTIARWLNVPEPQPPDWSPELWETFRFVCRVHGVAPFLCERLVGCEWLEEATGAWLAHQFDLNQQRIARMQADLKAILALFAANDLPLLPLKGSILTVEYYGQPGWRPMADLDLLIRSQDFAHSAELLGQLGYAQTVAHWKHTEFSKPENRQVISKEGEHPDNPRGLEIHCYCRETFGGPTIDLTEVMWGNAKPGWLLGEPAMRLKPEALWLHLLVHASYHLWQGKGRLIHLVDLAQVASQLTEPAVFLNAVEARFTFPALSLWHQYFPSPVNTRLLEQQRSRMSASFQAWVASLDLVNTSYLNPRPAGSYFGKALRFSEGRPQEVAQALRFAFLPSLAEIALDHPRLATSGLPWLGYFLLPFDWLKRLR
jgi:hypothetical protein